MCGSTTELRANPSGLRGTNICEMLDMYTKGELLVPLFSWRKETLHGNTVKHAVRGQHPEVYISLPGGICHRLLVWSIWSLSPFRSMQLDGRQRCCRHDPALQTLNFPPVRCSKSDGIWI